MAEIKLSFKANQAELMIAKLRAQLANQGKKVAVKIVK